MDFFNVAPSVIIIGPAGSGKTKMVRDYVLGRQCVWLDGLVSNDFTDCLAFIYRTMGIVSEKPSNTIRTFEELSEALLSQRRLERHDELVFVVDWLDRFIYDCGGAGGESTNKQQLIYGLLELTTMAPAMNIKVIGMTRRTDIIEGMEKRVRSRFSQNIVHLPFVDYRNCVADEMSGEAGYKVAVATTSNSHYTPLQMIVLAIVFKQPKLSFTMGTLWRELRAMEAYNGVCQERQFVSAIEQLIDHGLLLFKRNDNTVTRENRVIRVSVPKTMIYDCLSTNCQSLPLGVKSLVLLCMAG